MTTTAQPYSAVDGAEAWRAAGWWRDETILHDLRRWAALRPERPALVCYSGADARTVGYAELARRVDRLAVGLLRLGVRRGDVVTLQLPNSWELVALCLAAARIGAVAGPVVPTMRRREVEFMTRLTGSPVYIAAAEVRGFSYDEMSAEVAAAVPTLRHRVLLGGDGALTAGALDFTRDLYGPEPDPALLASLDALEAGPDDPAQIMFTSGTTGEPKGVVHSHNTLYAMNKAQADVLGLTGDEITAMGSPTTHQAGFTWNFVMPMLLGATAVQVDRWDAERMLGILQEQRVTFFMGAPTFLSDLIDAQRRTPHDLSALRSFATGSAPIAPLLVEDADVVLGCRVYALWGMTENGCVTVTRPGQPPLRAAESDGTAVPGMEVRITGKEGGPVPPGGSGRLQVRGAAQCLGYFRRPEVYAASVTADGWFDTGDLARDDGHGGIRIAGRVKDMIVRGAENIPVVEVEGALLRHPAVKDVAVVGYPDARLGERACAFLVTDGAELGLPDVRAHLAGLGMAKTYWPERVELLPELPRTPSGKIQKFVLRELLSDRSGPLAPLGPSPAGRPRV
ncbi:AMP-binding protein [Streptomyces sp. NPDC000345]|uniref:AMP-binding protein n=1 Tax=Streptomyces sp. NPDC000345 TaxID=3364537 RepID=UPI00367611E5